MQTLTDALAAGIGSVATGVEVVTLRLSTSGYAVAARVDGAQRVFRARAVVLAAPAYAAAPVIERMEPDAAAALAAIPYSPMATIVSVYGERAIEHPLDGFGFLVPSGEGRRILGTIFSSALFEGRAPQGQVLLTTFIGGARQPELVELGDAELADIVQEEHAALLGAQRAHFVRVHRWARAIPQYTMGHVKRMTELDAAERDLPGVFFCANYRGGVAVGDCIRSADAVASRAARFLGAPSNDATG